MWRQTTAWLSIFRDTLSIFISLHRARTKGSSEFSPPNEGFFSARRFKTDCSIAKDLLSVGRDLRSPFGKAAVTFVTLPRCDQPHTIAAGFSFFNAKAEFGLKGHVLEAPERQASAKS